MASCVRSSILFRSPALRTTEIRNGPALGAHRPASIICARSSSGTCVSRYALTLVLFAIASEICIIIVLCGVHTRMNLPWRPGPNHDPEARTVSPAGATRTHRSVSANLTPSTAKVAAHDRRSR